MSEDIARRPDKLTSAGLDELSVLPVFFKLAGKSVVIAGGSDAAAWKAELLAASGAQTYVFATNVSDKLKELTQRTGLVHIEHRQLQVRDFEGAALAIGDFETVEEIDAFRQMARKAGVICNIIQV